MSTVLALMVMFGVVSAFALIGQGVSDSRATLEMSGQLRQVATMLKNDLGGVTAVMSPPRSPESGEGYFEYTEGPIGPVVRPEAVARNNDTGQADTTVGDIDDILMFTVRSRTEPFIGRYAGGTAESYDAEIIWFVRGRTLYRRVLLVAPQLPVGGDGAGFYLQNDISVRLENGNLTANTLADLTKPENRFAHRPQHYYGGAQPFHSGFPFHPHFYVDYTAATPTLASSGWAPPSGLPWVGLMLPTLRECSYRFPPDATQPLSDAWIAGGDLPRLALTENGSFDAWRNPHPWSNVDPATGTLSSLPAPPPAPNTRYLGTRVAEDAILNNVIGFDVKAWDPGAPVLALLASGQVLMPGDPGYLDALRAVATGGATIVSYGAYVDLNYGCLAGPAGWPVLISSGSVFAGPGVTGLPGVAGHRNLGTDPGAPGGVLRSAVYDTWSRHYERELGTGRGINGFDDNGDGVVDDPDEMEFPPPYAAPLRGIQVKIRCFEPDSRQVREVTVIQEFVTK